MAGGPSAIPWSRSSGSRLPVLRDSRPPSRHSVQVDGRPDPVQEHGQSSNHRAAVLSASAVGCFYCRKIYSPTEIEDWIDEDESGVGQTAMCGRCGVDAVIPVRDGVDVEFLARMRRHWFSRS